MQPRLDKLLATVGITASLWGISIDVHSQPRPKVVASHNVICDLVKSIAEDTVDLTCLIDGDRDPHSYRPTPSQLKAIEEAQLVLYGGFDLEPQIAKLLQSTQDEEPQPRIALYEQAVSEPIMTEHEHEHEAEATSEQAELEPDPHIWHNIEHTVAIVELLESVFMQANPTEAERYLVNSATLTEQLWELDAWIKDRIATIPEGKNVLVTVHDSLNYYVRAYNLRDYKSLQGLSSSTSPTASQVKELAAEIRQAGVPTIFAESTAGDRVISNVARAAEVNLAEERLYVDGLGKAESYIEMMSHNTCAIVNGLGGKCTSFEAN